MKYIKALTYRIVPQSFPKRDKKRKRLNL